MYKIVRSDEEINRVLNWAGEGLDQGAHFPGMSYENGILNMLDWLNGDSDEAPDEN